MPGKLYFAAFIYNLFMHAMQHSIAWTNSNISIFTQSWCGQHAVDLTVTSS